MILSRKLKENKDSLTENMDEYFGAENALPMSESTDAEGARLTLQLEEGWGEVRTAIYTNECIELNALTSGSTQEEIDTIAEASASEMYTSVSNWFKKMGATIKEFIDKYIAKIKLFFTNDAKKLLAAHPVAKVSAKKFTDFKVKTFDWWNADTQFGFNAVSSVDSFVASSSFAVSKVDSAIKSMTAENLKKVQDEASDLVNKIYTNVGFSKAEAKKTLAKEMRGSESKIEVAIDSAKVKEVAKFLGGASEELGKIKSMRDSILKGIAKTIKELDGLKKRFGKDAGGASMNNTGSKNKRTVISGAPEGQGPNAIKLISVVINAQKTSKSIQQSLLNATVSTMQAKISAFMGIYKAAASYSPGKTKDENLNASYIAEAVSEMENLSVI